MDDEKKSAEKEPQQKGLISRLTSFMPRWLSIPFVIIVVICVYMVNFSDFSYKKSMSNEIVINDLKKKIKENSDSAIVYERKVNELNTDRESLEKLAREKYHMKRDKEDVYIIEDK